MSADLKTNVLKQVKQSFAKISYQDRRRLSLDLKKFLKLANAEQITDAALSIEEKLNAALERIKRRCDALPKISYDQNLPVFAKRDEIISAISHNQVVIIAGETGSGKTTQIPKICLEAGCGIRGLIGHTQPRRIAARAVASRIAFEFGEELGKSVGYKVRFTDTLSSDSYIKIMTDGILLAETASDRLLLNYDCIIIDEAHERSLNIDFLLGYLKNLLEKRPELKLVITSATIDPERFSKHFHNAPIIEVSGRTYPVEVLYMPLDGASAVLPTSQGEETCLEGDDEVMEVRDGVLKAIKFLFSSYGPGDVLVFLPGERDIMELAGFLNRSHLPGVEILPLYARLATTEQNKIFSPHGSIRVVLATNVAETSLTVPGIRYVIDPGVARISRYSPRTKVQRLPIEKISQASANQRKGRCGRVSSGVCVRLYSKEDFEQRPPYTDPEILRTNLAAVILQMINLRLGDIATFPFIDAPEPRQVTDGLRLLEELGAIEKRQNKDFNSINLTDIGLKLSKIPADPRLARMLIEAKNQGALSEVLIIVSALSVMDPRERPLERQEASSRMHQRFNDEKSDFLSFLKLHSYLVEQQKQLSSSAWKRKLKGEFLSYLRIREWFDVLRQLKASCSTLNFLPNQQPADYDGIHKSILSGLLSQIGKLDDNDKGYYLGARGIKFVIHPGSVLAGKSPKWICAGELSETSRLFARNVASIDPAWLENLAPHLIKKSYAEPHWSKKLGAVLANLTITLYGLPIVQNRKVQYANIDPKLCRSLLIRDGLVHGEMECSYAFFKHNLELIDEIGHVEDKLRRRDLLADESVLEQFYDERLPQDAITQRHFEKWWRRKRQETPDYLDFSLALVAKDGLDGVKENLYPEFWQHDKLRLPLSYVFNPGAEDDGVTVHIPITIINRVRALEFLYQIPGLRSEFLSNLIKSLPKRLRRNLIPAPDYAHALEEALGDGKDGNLYEKAARELTRMGGEVVKAEDFDKTQIPPYLFMNFSVEDLQGKVLAFGKNFDAIAEKLRGKAQEALQKTIDSHKVSPPSSTWSYGLISKEKITRQNGVEIIAYPALTDKGKGVSLELYDSKTRQMRAMRQGLLKLLVLSVKQPTSYLEQHLPNKAKLSMYYQPLGTVKDLLDDLVKAAVLLIMSENPLTLWDEASFKNLLEQVKANLNEKALELGKTVEPILYKAHELKRLLKGRIQLNTARSYADVNAQLDGLVFKGFISDTPLEHLREIPRYLQAANDRLLKLSRDPIRDLKYLGMIDEVTEKYENAVKLYQRDLIPDELKEIRWMIEELRVSYFDQQLGVKIQVSDKRIGNEISRILKEHPLHR